MRYVRRFTCALALSLAIHFIAFISASALDFRRPAAVDAVTQPLVIVLGPIGTKTGGGAPSESGPGGHAAVSAPPPAASTEAKLPTTEPKSVPVTRQRPSVARKEAAPSIRPVSPPKIPTPAYGRPGADLTASSSSSGVGGNVGQSGASGGGGGAGPLAVAYEQALASWLNSHKYYPASLRRRGIEGEGKLRIRIARSGRVLSVDTADAFPHPSLEAISQDWVKRAEPFPPVPDAIPGENYVFVVPVGFRLQ